MIRLRATLVLLLYTNANVAVAADRTDPGPGALVSAVLGTVAAGASTLQIMPAGGDNNEFIWAAWDDYARNVWTVHLMLLRREGHSVTLASPALQQGGRSPVLQIIPGWEFCQRPALLVSYQLGAAYTRAELYGVNVDHTAVRLGILEGALLEPMQIGGKQVLLIHESADLQDPPKCFGWDAQRHKLIQQTCDAGRIGTSK